MQDKDSYSHYLKVIRTFLMEISMFQILREPLKCMIIFGILELVSNFLDTNNLAMFKMTETLLGSRWLSVLGEIWSSY